ncbi:DUF6192 family protein [Streptomyces sp. MS1.HAVA.3]|uniref:DUF6192 family protein n=1 Tax=Streptomyces caledonius TaxID=3134107 RepID=A0ABU8U6X5_9ACTN
MTTGLRRRREITEQVSREETARVVEELTRDEFIATEVTTRLSRRPGRRLQGHG